MAYDLITATTPDADQVIALQVDDDGASGEKQASQPSAGQAEEKIYNLGDNLPVRTGVILDHNGHPVPDGTVVKFILSQQGENVTVQQIESTTSGGIARASIKLQSEGMHEIRVTSEPAQNSQILLLNITPGKGAEISAINPTPAPTEAENSAAPGKTPAEENAVEEKVKNNNKILEWLLAVCWPGAAGCFSSIIPKRLANSGSAPLSVPAS